MDDPSQRHDDSGDAPDHPRVRVAETTGITVEQLLHHITPRVWVTPALAILVLVGFGVELALGVSFASPTAQQLLKAGGEFGPSFADGQWWRALTSMFLHAGPLHLAFNMWAFYSVGPLTERVFGNRAFLAVYLLSGIGGSLASLAWSPLSVGVGASGAIFGVYGALLAFMVLHRGVFPPAYLAQRRNSIIGFIGYNVVFGLSQKNTDIAAHAGGLVVGALAGAALARDVLHPAGHLLRRITGAAGVAALLLFTAFVVRARLLHVPEIEAERADRAALVHLRAKEYPKAIERFSRSLVLRRDRASLFNRGIAYLENGEPKVALADFRDAHAMEANLASHTALCEVGVTLATTDTVEDALSHCTAAVAYEQQTPARRAHLFSVRSAARGIQSRPADALADAEAALVLDDTIASARMRRAWANLDLGNVLEAERDCERLLSGPDATAGADMKGTELHVCARVARKQQNLGLARTLVERALALDPDDRFALFERAFLNGVEGRLAEALTDYSARLRLDPNMATAWNNRAWVEVELGDFASARSDAERAVSLEPGSASHLGTLCFALAGLEEREAARGACRKALEIHGENGFDRGMLAFLENRPADARREWQKVSADSPVSARQLRAWIAKLPAR